MATTEPTIYISETSAMIILAVIVVMFLAGIIFAMISDYRLYLDNHWNKQYSFTDFIKQERFFIFILLFFLFMVGGELVMIFYYRNYSCLVN